MLSSNIDRYARKPGSASLLRCCATIVDEKLQMQEAKRQNVTATDDEINKAMGQIEKQNNMQSGQLTQVLKARGIERSALVDQLTASIVWAKLVRRLVSQTNVVSDEEIDYALKRAKETANEPQSRVAEIFLAVDNPQQEDEVRRLAERLTEQMKQGARFSAVAQQFSQSATAAVGGDIGWVRAEQLGPELGKAVAQMRPGELSPPIRTGGRLLPGAGSRRRAGRAARPAKRRFYTSCRSSSRCRRRRPSRAPRGHRRGAERRDSRQELPGAAEDRQGKGSPQLSSEGRCGRPDAPAMRNIVQALEPEGLAADHAKERGRRDHGLRQGGARRRRPATRDEVRRNLMRQRLDTLARRYMRDLRRTAYRRVRV